MTEPEEVVPSRLTRRLGTFDAVVIGLGAMIGAGVFAALGPAADAAGSGLLLGLLAAGIVAYCNATSSAQLAALYPASGGTYVYGRERLGPFWGYLAGWGFVIGKTASCSAIALTFATYAGNGEATRPLAIAAVVALTAVNFFGVRKTALLTRALVTIVLASLACVVIASLFGGQASIDNIGSLTGEGWHGILQSGGLLFFAFAGYPRIATLGEEVKEPRSTIPRAIRSRSASRSRCTHWSRRPPCSQSDRTHSPPRRHHSRPSSGPAVSIGWPRPCGSARRWHRSACCCRCSRVSAARASQWRQTGISPRGSKRSTPGTAFPTVPSSSSPES